MVNLIGEIRQSPGLIPEGRLAPMKLRNEPGFGKTIVDALSEVAATTPEELASRVRVSELIVRSVLEAMAYTGMVEFEPCTGRYSRRFLPGSRI